MVGSLVASDVRGQLVGPAADVRAWNPIVVFAADGDKRVQTKALRACILRSACFNLHQCDSRLCNGCSWAGLMSS